MNHLGCFEPGTRDAPSQSPAIENTGWVECRSETRTCEADRRARPKRREERSRSTRRASIGRTRRGARKSASQ